MISPRVFLIIFFLLQVAQSAWAWRTGERVLGQWIDGWWYVGKVDAKVNENEYIVRFDDGSARQLMLQQIRYIDWMVGTHLQCDVKGINKYAPFKILSMKDEGLYVKNTNTGKKEYTTLGRCRIQVNQTTNVEINTQPDR